MYSDLLSQITRCRERIKENIMPHVYEHKLEELLVEQEERELVITQYEYVDNH
jgi:hypothetical protein